MKTRAQIIGQLAKLNDKLPPRPWSVYNKPLRAQFSKTKIIEIQDRDGNAVIPWAGFDNIDVKNRRAIARFIVGIVNGYERLAR